MQSTQEIAANLGCSIQAINKARRTAEAAHNLKLGQPDPRDKRKILFSETEVELILKHAPKKAETVSETIQKPGLETVYDGVYEAEIAPPALVVYTPTPLARNPSLCPAKAPEIAKDTALLDLGIHEANTASAYSFSELEGYVEGFVEAKFDNMLTRLDHAITSIGANALNKKVQGLSQPTPQAQPQRRAQRV